MTVYRLCLTCEVAWVNDTHRCWSCTRPADVTKPVRELYFPDMSMWMLNEMRRTR